MAEQSPATLKNYFVTGSIPTQTDFSDLIDSSFNKTEGISATSVKGTLTSTGQLTQSLSGTVSVITDQPKTVNGNQTQFKSELWIGAPIKIGSFESTVTAIESDIRLTIETASPSAISNQSALTAAALFSVNNYQSQNQFVVSPEGKVGIGTESPSSQLEVNGNISATTISATKFVGSGSQLTGIVADTISSKVSVPANQISGSLPATQVEGLLTSTGDLTQALSGVVSIQLDKATDVQGNQTKFTSELWVGAPIKIGSFEASVSAIESDVQLTIDKTAPTAISNQAAFTATPLFFVNNYQSQNQFIVSPEGKVGIGTTQPKNQLEVNGNISATTISATKFVGSGSQLTGIVADTISSKVSVPANQISGSLPATQVEGLLTSSGSVNQTLTGTVSIAMDKPTFVHGNQTKFTTELWNGAPIQIGQQAFTVSSIVSDIELTLTEAASQAVSNQSAKTESALFQVKNSSNELQVQVSGCGNLGLGVQNPTNKLDVNGNVKAMAFIGDGKQLTGIMAESLSAKVSVPANQISGVLTTSQIPSIPADKINTQLSLNQIPSLSTRLVQFYCLSPYVKSGKTVTLNWVADTDYQLQLNYIESGAIKLEKIDNAEKTSGTYSVTVSDNTLFTLTATNPKTSDIFQHQLWVCVLSNSGKTPVEYIESLHSAGDSMADIIQKTAQQFNYTQLNTTNFTDLVTALLQANISANTFSKAVFSYYAIKPGVSDYLTYLKLMAKLISKKQ